MNRHAYFALPHVSGFIAWFAAELDSEARFKHEYVDRRSGMQCRVTACSTPLIATAGTLRGTRDWSALEAALFMIGYDLGQPRPALAV